MIDLDGDSLDYEIGADLGYRLNGTNLSHADGGYLLIRFDIDELPGAAVHVDPPGGWFASVGEAPADMVRRGATYLAALADKLEQIEALS